MPEAVQFVCPHCDMINRISRSAPRWRAADAYWCRLGLITSMACVRRRKWFHCDGSRG